MAGNEKTTFREWSRTCYDAERRPLKLNSAAGQTFQEKVTQTYFDVDFTDRYWRTESVHTIQNPRLAQKYAAARIDLEKQGRPKECLDDVFAFSYGTEKIVQDICQDGQRVGLKRRHVLGHTGSGVHLVRHYDILTRYMAQQSVYTPIFVVVYKILLGKSKPVLPRLHKQDKFLRPVVGYDSHVSARNIEPTMPICEALNCSYVYLYEHDEVSSNTVKFPRQILPYAIIHLVKKVPVMTENPMLAMATHLSSSSGAHWEVKGETRRGFRFMFSKSGLKGKFKTLAKELRQSSCRRKSVQHGSGISRAMLHSSKDRLPVLIKMRQQKKHIQFNSKPPKLDAVNTQAHLVHGTDIAGFVSDSESFSGINIGNINCTYDQSRQLLMKPFVKIKRLKRSAIPKCLISKERFKEKDIPPTTDIEHQEKPNTDLSDKSNINGEEQTHGLTNESDKTSVLETINEAVLPKTCATPKTSGDICNPAAENMATSSDKLEQKEDGGQMETLLYLEGREKTKPALHKKGKPAGKMRYTTRPGKFGQTNQIKHREKCKSTLHIPNLLEATKDVVTNQENELAYLFDHDQKDNTHGTTLIDGSHVACPLDSKEHDINTDNTVSETGENIRNLTLKHIITRTLPSASKLDKLEPSNSLADDHFGFASVTDDTSRNENISAQQNSSDCQADIHNQSLRKLEKSMSPLTGYLAPDMLNISPDVTSASTTVTGIDEHNIALRANAFVSDEHNGSRVVSQLIIADNLDKAPAMNLNHTDGSHNKNANDRPKSPIENIRLEHSYTSCDKDKAESVFAKEINLSSPEANCIDQWTKTTDKAPNEIETLSTLEKSSIPPAHQQKTDTPFVKHSFDSQLALPDKISLTKKSKQNTASALDLSLPPSKKKNTAKQRPRSAQKEQCKSASVTQTSKNKGTKGQVQGCTTVRTDKTGVKAGKCALTKHCTLENEVVPKNIQTLSKNDHLEKSKSRSVNYTSEKEVDSKNIHTLHKTVQLEECKPSQVDKTYTNKDKNGNSSRNDSTDVEADEGAFPKHCSSEKEVGSKHIETLNKNVQLEDGKSFPVDCNSENEVGSKNSQAFNKDVQLEENELSTVDHTCTNQETTGLNRKLSKSDTLPKQCTSEKVKHSQTLIKNVQRQERKTSSVNRTTKNKGTILRPSTSVRNDNTGTETKESELPTHCTLERGPVDEIVKTLNITIETDNAIAKVMNDQATIKKEYVPHSKGQDVCKSVSTSLSKQIHSNSSTKRDDNYSTGTTVNAPKDRNCEIESIPRNIESSDSREIKNTLNASKPDNKLSSKINNLPESETKGYRLLTIDEAEKMVVENSDSVNSKTSECTGIPTMVQEALNNPHDFIQSTISKESGKPQYAKYTDLVGKPVTIDKGVADKVKNFLSSKVAAAAYKRKEAQKENDRLPTFDKITKTQHRTSDYRSPVETKAYNNQMMDLPEQTRNHTDTTKDSYETKTNEENSASVKQEMVESANEVQNFRSVAIDSAANGVTKVHSAKDSQKMVNADKETANQKDLGDTRSAIVKTLRELSVVLQFLSDNNQKATMSMNALPESDRDRFNKTDNSHLLMPSDTLAVSNVKTEDTDTNLKGKTDNSELQKTTHEPWQNISIKAEPVDEIEGKVVCDVDYRQRRKSCFQVHTDVQYSDIERRDELPQLFDTHDQDDITLLEHFGVPITFTRNEKSLERETYVNSSIGCVVPVPEIKMETTNTFSKTTCPSNTLQKPGVLNKGIHQRKNMFDVKTSKTKVYPIPTIIGNFHKTTPTADPLVNMSGPLNESQETSESEIPSSLNTIVTKQPETQIIEDNTENAKLVMPAILTNTEGIVPNNSTKESTEHLKTNTDRKNNFAKLTESINREKTIPKEEQPNKTKEKPSDKINSDPNVIPFHEVMILKNQQYRKYLRGTTSKRFIDYSDIRKRRKERIEYEHSKKKTRSKSSERNRRRTHSSSDQNERSRTKSKSRHRSHSPYRKHRSRSKSQSTKETSKRALSNDGRRKGMSENQDESHSPYRKHRSRSKSQSTKETSKRARSNDGRRKGISGNKEESHSPYRKHRSRSKSQSTKETSKRARSNDGRRKGISGNKEESHSPYRKHRSRSKSQSTKEKSKRARSNDGRRKGISENQDDYTKSTKKSKVQTFNGFFSWRRKYRKRKEHSTPGAPFFPGIAATESAKLNRKKREKERDYLREKIENAIKEYRRTFQDTTGDKKGDTKVASYLHYLTEKLQILQVKRDNMNSNTGHGRNKTQGLVDRSAYKFRDMFSPESVKSNKPNECIKTPKNEEELDDLLKTHLHRHYEYLTKQIKEELFSQLVGSANTPGSIDESMLNDMRKCNESHASAKTETSFDSRDRKKFSQGNNEFHQCYSGTNRKGQMDNKHSNFQSNARIAQYYGRGGFMNHAPFVPFRGRGRGRYPRRPFRGFRGRWMGRSFYGNNSRNLQTISTMDAHGAEMKNNTGITCEIDRSVVAKDDIVDEFDARFYRQGFSATHAEQDRGNGGNGNDSTLSTSETEKRNDHVETSSLKVETKLPQNQNTHENEHVDQLTTLPVDHVKTSNMLQDVHGALTETIEDIRAEGSSCTKKTEAQAEITKSTPQIDNTQMHTSDQSQMDNKDAKLDIQEKTVESQANNINTVSISTQKDKLEDENTIQPPAGDGMSNIEKMIRYFREYSDIEDVSTNENEFDENGIGKQSNSQTQTQRMEKDDYDLHRERLQSLRDKDTRIDGQETKMLCSKNTEAKENDGNRAEHSPSKVESDFARYEIKFVRKMSKDTESELERKRSELAASKWDTYNPDEGDRSLSDLESERSNLEKELGIERRRNVQARYLRQERENKNERVFKDDEYCRNKDSIIENRNIRENKQYQTDRRRNRDNNRDSETDDLLRRDSIYKRRRSYDEGYPDEFRQEHEQGRSVNRIDSCERDERTELERVAVGRSFDQYEPTHDYDREPRRALLECDRFRDKSERNMVQSPEHHLISRRSNDTSIDREHGQGSNYERERKDSLESETIPNDYRHERRQRSYDIDYETWENDSHGSSNKRSFKSNNDGEYEYERRLLEEERRRSAYDSLTSEYMDKRTETYVNVRRDIQSTDLEIQLIEKEKKELERQRRELELERLRMARDKDVIELQRLKLMKDESERYSFSSRGHFYKFRPAYRPYYFRGRGRGYRGSYHTPSYTRSKYDLDKYTHSDSERIERDDRSYRDDIDKHYRSANDFRGDGHERHFRSSRDYREDRDRYSGRSSRDSREEDRDKYSHRFSKSYRDSDYDRHYRSCKDDRDGDDRDGGARDSDARDGDADRHYRSSRGEDSYHLISSRMKQEKDDESESVTTGGSDVEKNRVKSVVVQKS
ncbi:uncharacterized protein LOC128203716 isoform X1 [Mya arenaria]|uniref:uncharacterized protein LOC128203716 isoform X1 n=1 Tax=Mya arenaria TaxID=6604 RepID=UPI0022DF9931|nr:uncharacterized protein LOC128203716 isoform X1 [Mya arenaria]